MRQTYMDHHLILLSNLCMSVCILSDDMKNGQAIITAVIICLECSWGYGYVCVRIVLTLPILRVPKSGRGLPLCLSEPMGIYFCTSKQYTSCFGEMAWHWTSSNFKRNWCKPCLHDYILCQISTLKGKVFYMILYWRSRARGCSLMPILIANWTTQLWPNLYKNIAATILPNICTINL